MNHIGKELFRAIHEGCWLAVDYHNKKNEKTSCWICVRELDPLKRKLRADGMHLGKYSLASLNLNIDQILSARVLSGTYAPVSQSLVDDIRQNPQKYESVFSSAANLRILNYLSDCYRLDHSPYLSDFTLIDRMDDEIIRNEEIHLNERQFKQIVKGFRKENEKNVRYALQVKQFGMNLLSLHTPRGKYLLAYQPLRLDVFKATLCAADDIVICTEFTMNGTRQSIRRFMDADDLPLLEDFKTNAEAIREAIVRNNPGIEIDDMPYMIQVCRDPLISLDAQYDGILRMYQKKPPEATVPIQAFFGELTAQPRRLKASPPALIDRKVNLDQLLAVSHAMRHPVSYVQGPPGTGKTMTIVHTMITAFYNRKTVLFASGNNHPIDEAVNKLRSVSFNGRPVPFPLIRLGSNSEILTSLKQIRGILEAIRKMKYSADMLKEDPFRGEQAKMLSDFLDRYETRLNLLERKEAMEELLKSSRQLNFSLQLETKQLPEITGKINAYADMKVEDAMRFIDTDFQKLLQYLYYLSVRCLKRILEPKNQDLLDILKIEDEQMLVRQFNEYLSVSANLKKFLRIFPLVATTCLSACKLGDPEPSFDMVIIDEASQCNTAVSLVPIIRGHSLMLVGDPQQLRPVILLNPSDSQSLRRKYGIGEEYDYCTGSIYKTMLACDALSDEVLLSHHYRCDPKIINFNNRKYYNGKLRMMSESRSKNPLVYIDIPDNSTTRKNTAPQEVNAILSYIRSHPEQNIGVITPFVRQKELIQKELEQHQFQHVSVGTVHAFQGDEKDVILFSLAITPQTRQQTYDWLKNNRELINVSASRARSQLIVISSDTAVDHLHASNEPDDLYDLISYVRSAGVCRIAEHTASSRALGIRPYSTETEEAFMENLTHALDNAFADGRRYTVHKEVAISQVFTDNISHDDYFFRGRFDFVVFRRRNKQEIPVLAIELDGKEHLDDETVRIRDKKKEAICHEHGFELIRVDNTYARRYHYIKEILICYFRS